MRQQWMNEAAKEAVQHNIVFDQEHIADIIERFWEAEQIRNPHRLRAAAKAVLEAYAGWKMSDASFSDPEYESLQTAIEALHAQVWPNAVLPPRL